MDGTAAVHTDLIGLSREELTATVAALGLPAFRARQLWHWMYCRGARDFSEMTSIAAKLRTDLAQSFTLRRPAVGREQTSSDGTRKWLLGFADGNEAEAVFIPESDRGALCVSTQVGCTLTCRFCHTGTQRLVRNLTAAEIVGQVLIARDSLGEWPTPAGPRLLSHVVVMGMGEPLFNFDNVAKGLRIVMDPEGIAVSRRRITLSTSGVVPVMRRVGAELGVKLAVSLHAARDEIRDRLMPINKKYPLAELMRACREYPGADNAHRITFEYLMLADVNDSAADARALVKLVGGIPCKFNLIPFNPWPGAAFACSSSEAIDAFADVLRRGGYTATVRESRGQDILAACGQLRSASESGGQSRFSARPARGIAADDHRPARHEPTPEPLDAPPVNR